MIHWKIIIIIIIIKILSLVISHYYTNNKINVATVKTYTSDDKINPLRIISAGKQIKNVFYCIMMNMLLVLINFGYILIAEEYNKSLIIFSLVFALIFTIMELVNLSGAGDDLIHCQKPD